MNLPFMRATRKLNNLTELHQSLHSSMATKITAAQKRQKINYDRRRDNSKTFEKGSLVWMKNRKQIHRMGDKMKPRFMGPYTVVECLDKGLVRLKVKK